MNQKLAWIGAGVYMAGHGATIAGLALFGPVAMVVGGVLLVVAALL